MESAFYEVAAIYGEEASNRRRSANTTAEHAGFAGGIFARAAAPGIGSVVHEDLTPK